MKITSLINWKLFGYLLALGLFGVVSIFPFLISTQGEILKELPISIPLVLSLSILQSGLLISVAIFVGLLLGKKVGLGAPLLEKISKNKIKKEKLKVPVLLYVIAGVITGFTIIVLDKIFSQFIGVLAFESVPIWQGVLASFYGGIVEEILMRLFLVTFLVWIFSKLFRIKKPNPIILWSSIVIAAIIFGISHLPATAQLTTITPLIVFRAILLNGIGGMVFGWLYWEKGLESAMIAHYSTDIILLVVFPLLIN